MRRTIPIALFAALALASACRPAEAPAPPRGDLRPSLSAKESPLYVLYPHLDQRIVSFEAPRDANEAKRIARYYPDLWDAEIVAIRDFAVDTERLYALASKRHAVDDPHLWIASQKTGALERKLKLSPSPEHLKWATEERLLVGYAASKERAGGLGVVDVKALRQIAFVALVGACVDLVSSGDRAFVIERTERLIGGNDVFATFQLVAIDLKGGAVLKRRPIPAGARELVIGPTGLLYVAHVSGSGLHSTDATLSVFAPADLARVDRLPFELAARGMASGARHLVASLHKENGDVWFNATADDHSTVFDFRFAELVTDQLVVIDEIAYVPLRQQNAIERVDLAAKKRLPRLSLGAQAYRDGSGLVRTRPASAAPQQGTR